MNHDKSRIARINTQIATVVAIATTVALPFVYFLVAYQYTMGSLEAEAEVNARNIGAIIDNNPQLWRFESVRLEELLKRRPRTGEAETRRVFDKSGELVAESVDSLTRPLISKSDPLNDGEKVVGQIAIARSLMPIVLRTGLVGLVGLVFGVTIFVSLLRLPRKALAELERAEEKLQQFAQNLQEINEELKNFAYIISHDLRAPLVNIKGFAGELQSCMAELDEIRKKGDVRQDGNDGQRLLEIMETDVPEAIEFINSSVSRMDNLIGLILKLSRIGHRELKPEEVNLNELVAGILKTLTHQLEQKQAQVIVGELPVVCQDRVALEQIVGNLLDNAVKYLDQERPGRLEITAERTHDGYVLNFKDNGRGISLDDLHKVFEIFRRAGKQDVQGEGMGLAYVKALVRRLGGQIWCTSEFGVGSTFSFSLPDTENGMEAG